MLRDAVARRITLVLGEHGLDKAPLDWVIAELNVPEQPARDAIARHPGLGIIDRDGQPVVWSTHPAPIAAGFRPVLDGDRLMLRLPGHRPLFISGEHLGAVPAEQIVDGVDELRLGEPGVGELGYAVARMALMARRWLAVPRPPAAEAQRAQWLFERIADAWRRNPGPIASVRKLRLHRVALGSSVGRPYWLGDETTNQLEIVTWTDEHARTVLVNAYPSRTERPLFHRAAISHSVNSVVAVAFRTAPSWAPEWWSGRTPSSLPDTSSTASCPLPSTWTGIRFSRS